MVNHLCVVHIVSLNRKFKVSKLFIRSLFVRFRWWRYISCFDSGILIALLRLVVLVVPILLLQTAYLLLHSLPHTADASREADGKSAADSAADTHTRIVVLLAQAVPCKTV